MLAYLFWHRQAAGVEREAYEEAQRGFHAALAVPSACFRVAELPFGSGGQGYEDWYLVDDWAALGELNALAVDASHRADHDRAAELSSHGWGGLYGLLGGAAEIPAGVRWLDKPRGEDLDAFLTAAGAADEAGAGAGVWQRRLVLGPAPELCLAAPADATRTRVA